MSHLRMTEKQLQEHKNKSKTKLVNVTDEYRQCAQRVFIFEKPIIKEKRRNKDHEEQMKREFYRLLCLQLPKEVEFLYRIEPFAFRKLITKQNAGIAMGISKQLQNTGYQKGEFDYEFRKITKLDDYKYSLWIEFKYGKNKLTLEQEAFKIQQESQGRKCAVCYSADEGVEAVKKYLRGEL